MAKLFGVDFQNTLGGIFEGKLEQAQLQKRLPGILDAYGNPAFEHRLSFHCWGAMTAYSDYVRGQRGYAQDDVSILIMQRALRQAEQMPTLELWDDGLGWIDPIAPTSWQTIIPPGFLPVRPVTDDHILMRGTTYKIISCDQDPGEATWEIRGSPQNG